MTVPITRRPHFAHTPKVVSQEIKLDPNLSLPEQLKSLGLFDDQYNLLFTPSKIPPISQNGRKRWDELMDRKIQGVMTHAEYIEGYAKELSVKGIQIDSYLKGGYAAYVACIDEYFDFLIAEFLASKNLPKNLFAKGKVSKEEPNDADFFDHVITEGIPPTAHKSYFAEFLKQNNIWYTKRLIPKESPLFPHKENYVLYVVDKTDRIIGRLHHPYLFTRDDIQIKVQKGNLVPESSGNFWQMVMDRYLKIVRIEPWHEKNFRAGLAIHQLLQEGHILIENQCSLQQIIHHAVTLGEKGIFTGALDRAKLHCKKPQGFLVSVLIAYLHAAKQSNYVIPNEHLQILTDAIGEIPPLPGLYKLALLLTCYKDSTHHAEWETPDRLVLYFNEHKYIFPKDFALTSTGAPFFSVAGWSLNPFRSLDCVYTVLDGELSSLERVLFELACQKPFTPLSESLKQVLVEHLLSGKQIDLSLFHPWIPQQRGWVPAMIKYSLRHGLILWNGLKGKMDVKIKEKTLEEIVLILASERPNQAYAILDQEDTPLRQKFLKILIENPLLSKYTSQIIFEELKDSQDIKVLKDLDRLEISEEWFFNSSPCKERIEAFYQHTKNIKVLVKWLSLTQDLSVLLKFKNDLKSAPESYISLIKLFHLPDLAKEWIGSFPLKERLDQTLLFFVEYNQNEYPLLENICSLPGLDEQKLLKILFQKGFPVYADHSFSKMISFLNGDSPKIEILKMLNPCNEKEIALLKRYLEMNLDLSYDFIPHCQTSENPLLHKLALDHLIYLKSLKPDERFDPLWLISLNSSSPDDLIPFFQNRKWVESVYGSDAETKTQEWGETVLKKCATVQNILSRNKLIYTPEIRLKIFLESIFNINLVNDDMILPYCEKLMSSFLTSLQNKDGDMLYILEKLLQLFQITEADALTIFTKAIESISFPPEEFTNCFLQTMPLRDFATRELYDEWNDRKKKIHQDWTQAKDPFVLTILSYETAKACLDYSRKFQLITEQFIENRLSKKEFQEEAQELILSVNSEFGSQELGLNEDPRLICIQNLSFLLKAKNKRERAYEAFIYLLQGENQSQIIDKQLKHLEIRKKTEERIVAQFKLIEKTGYYDYLHSIRQCILDLSRGDLLPKYSGMDPIQDAFESHSLELIDRVYLQIFLINTLAKYFPDHQDRVAYMKSYLFFENKLLIEKDVENYLQKRINLLKSIVKSLPTEKQMREVKLLYDIVLLFPRKKQDIYMRYIKDSLSITINISFK